MAVTEKPKRVSPQRNLFLPEDDVRALIEKGGVPAQVEAQEKTRLASSGKQKLESKKMKLVQLRLPDELLVRIDKAREGRLVKVPRHTWFLEAILKQLSEEESEKTSVQG